MATTEDTVSTTPFSTFFINIIFAVVAKFTPNQLSTEKYFLISKTDTPFHPKINVTDATNGRAEVGTEIWDNKQYKISSLSNELKDATLFQSSFEAKGTSISIGSNKNAKVYIALLNDPTGEVSTALQNNGWKLENKLFLEYVDGDGQKVFNPKKFDKVLSQNINDTDPIILDRPNLIPDSVPFAIMIKEGKF